MIEIRPIRKEEGANFLQLLCDVFNLDYKRAEAVFFTEPLFDLDRKWALFEGGQMVSILTTVGLEFGWGRAIGVAGVATIPDRRQEGLAATLLERVLSHSERQGEPAAFLFARDERLYSKLGFERLDAVVKGRIDGAPERDGAPSLSFDEVRGVYERWALRSDERLRRDDRRWAYWQWSFRLCTASGAGYFCFEGDTIREAVDPEYPLPIGAHAEWFGLRSVAHDLRLPLVGESEDLVLLGRRAPSVPQMFMSDQF